MKGTIPVNVIHDNIYGPCNMDEEVIADRFQILEIDGYYLVIQETLLENGENTQEYVCFELVREAYEYLEDLGVEIDGWKEKDYFSRD